MQSFIESISRFDVSDRSLFGKESIARAAGVTKSAIETQFVAVCKAMFRPRVDFRKLNVSRQERLPEAYYTPSDEFTLTPAIPDLLSGEERRCMLSAVILLRFPPVRIAEDVAAASRVKGKIALLAGCDGAELATAFEEAKERIRVAVDNRGKAAVDVTGKPSLRKMAKIIGCSASAMTSRFNTVKLGDPNATDAELVMKMWNDIGAPKPRISFESFNAAARFYAVVMSQYVGGVSVGSNVAVAYEEFCSAISVAYREQVAELLLARGSYGPDDVRFACSTAAASLDMMSVGVGLPLEQVVSAYLDGGNIEHAVFALVNRSTVASMFVDAIPNEIKAAVVNDVPGGVVKRRNNRSSNIRSRVSVCGRQRQQSPGAPGAHRKVASCKV